MMEPHMDELLKKANIPDDQPMYIGELIDEPFLGKIVFRNNFSVTHYSLHTRPLRPTEHRIIDGDGEIVLASAEHIPVHIIGSDQIIPTWEARKSGHWTPSDDYFSIRETDLTPEQARQARYFVQPIKTKTRDKTA